MTKFPFVLLIAASVLSCNEGVSGFNAEAGSTVSVPASQTVKITGTFNVIWDLSVTTSAGTPANGIQVQLICTNCTLLDRPNGDGGTITTDNLSEFQAVPIPHIVKTNARGGYQLIVQIQPPANIGATTYDAQVSSDIGVGGAVNTIT